MNNLSYDTIARVEEIVTDVLAMDLLHSSPSFFRKVLEVAGERGDMSLVAIRRSAADTSLGETDIELIANGPVGRCGILIENKVRAADGPPVCPLAHARRSGNTVGPVDAVPGDPDVASKLLRGSRPRAFCSHRRQSVL